MREIKTLVIDTKPLNTFSPDVLTAYLLICQYIDELCLRSGADIGSLSIFKQESQSWGIKNGSNNVSPILIKAFPWDNRMHIITDLVQNCCDEGVAIMIRNEYLSALNMQELWKEFGNSYYPSPTNFMYSTSSLHKDKPFQLIILCLGRCDLLSLPGTNMELIEEQLNEIYLNLKDDSHEDIYKEDSRNTEHPDYQKNNKDGGYSHENK